MIIKLLHFNDVYHLKPRKKEPVAGIARFLTALKQQRNSSCNVLTLCSGDCFSPSIESTITQGTHWIPIYNMLSIDVACFGNHDFDFGLDQLLSLASQCNFPWLLSNVKLLSSDDPSDIQHQQRQIDFIEQDFFSLKNIANAHNYHVIQFDTLRIGFIGLGELEWLETIPNLPSNVKYLSFIDCAKYLATYLRSVENCNFVIALTHMRLHNDKILMDETSGLINLILGGHDHFYKILNDSVTGYPKVIKSGTDFMDLSVVTLEYDITESSGNLLIQQLSVDHIQITSSFEEDPQLLQLIQSISSEFELKLSKVLCSTVVPLDARSSQNRTQETNLASFTADIMRIYFDSNCSLLVGGSVRADCVFDGEFTLGNLMDCFPYEDPLVLVRISGSVLKQVLENGVSAYPKEEGRFPQVSGLIFSFDPSRKPMERLTQVQVYRKDLNEYETVDDSQFYTMVIRYYIYQGNDGYQIFKQKDSVELVSSPDTGIMLSALLTKYFASLTYSKESNDTVEDKRDNGSRLRAQLISMKSELNLLDTREFIPTINPQVMDRINIIK